MLKTRRLLKNVLSSRCARIQDAAALDISYDIRKGYPAEEILKDQHEKNPDRS